MKNDMATTSTDDLLRLAWSAAPAGALTTSPFSASDLIWSRSDLPNVVSSG